MRNILFIIIIIFSINILSNESYIIKENNVYKITIDENGDTISVEKIKTIIQNNIKKNDTLQIKENLLNDSQINNYLFNEDKPLYYKYIKVNWETALLTFPIGFMYGNMLAVGVSDYLDIAKSAAFFNAIMPIAMFYLPVKIIDENEVYSVTPFIKDGYYRGVYDYFMIASIIDNMNTDKIFTNNNVMASVGMGFCEAWGGYYIAKKKQIKRRTGLFYSRGGLLGDAWGVGLAAYLNSIYDFKEHNVEWAFPTIVLSNSFLMRGISSYYANADKYHWLSKDSDIILLNSIILTGIPLEIILRTHTEDKHLIFYSLEGTSILSAFALSALFEKNNIHFNDGNSLLMLTGTILGTFLGSSVYMFIKDTDTVLPLLLGALSGEVGVYFLRKNEVNYSNNLKNINFNIYPQYNNNNYGIRCNLSFNF